MDASKRIKCRKRHILVDTLGLPYSLNVQAASLQDRVGAKVVFQNVKGQLTRLRKIWADLAYKDTLIDWVKEQCGWTLIILEKRPEQKTFELLPRLWVVERSSPPRRCFAMPG